MKFKIGQTVKINETTLKVAAFVEKFALAVDMRKGIVNGGFIPVILTLNEDNTKMAVVTDANVVQVALKQILTSGQYV